MSLAVPPLPAARRGWRAAWPSLAPSPPPLLVIFLSPAAPPQLVTRKKTSATATAAEMMMVVNAIDQIRPEKDHTEMSEGGWASFGFGGWDLFMGSAARPGWCGG